MIINRSHQTGINADELSDKHLSELGKAQWSVLRSIEKQYLGRKVKDSDNVFEDNEWIWRNSYSEYAYEASKNIYWDNYNSLESIPRKIITKVICFRMAENEGLSLSTIDSYARRFSLIFRSLDSKEILKGEENTPLVGVNLITRDDVEEFIDSMLIRTPSPTYIDTFAAAFSSLYESLSHVSNGHAFLKIHNILPWNEDGVSSINWINRRLADLNLTKNEVGQFESFGPHTCDALVKNSLDIMDNYADVICNLFEESYEENRGKDTYILFSKKRKEEHFPLLNNIFDENSILPLKTINYRSYSSRKMISRQWYTDAFQLTQSAMLNIVLFTTGLRNIDIRLLKVGSCRPAKTVKNLYYVYVDEAIKTSSAIDIPVPEQTYRAIKILERLRISECEFLVARSSRRTGYKNKIVKDNNNPTKEENAQLNERYKRNITGLSLNNLIKRLAEHFNIPYENHDGDDSCEGMAHRYRATSAGWLASSSNLAVIMVRRLFGHSNTLMPLSYLHHNPIFIATLEEIRENGAKLTAEKLTKAASTGKIAGNKGRELNNGYKYQEGKCQSANDQELLYKNFQEQLKSRIIDGQLCGFITPLAVICGRNTMDTSPTPCAKRAYKNEINVDGIDETLLSQLSLVRPDQCIGNKCKEGIVGEWSTELKDSFIWYAKYLKGLNGSEFTDEHFKEEARMFISQYGKDMKTVFGLDENDA